MFGGGNMFEHNYYGFGPILKDYLGYHRISQSDFAKRLGITQKHMNEILNNKAEISVELMLAFNLITDIDVDLIWQAEEEKRIYLYLKEKFQDGKKLKEYLKSFSIKELKDKGWLKFKDEKSLIQVCIDLFKFLSIKNFDTLNDYSEQSILYKKNNLADMNKVMLWIKHCDSLINGLNICKYDKNKFVNLIDDLKILSLEKFDENNIVKCLNKYGIYLVIEDALNGTKIRGCMMVKADNPVIYLTKLYKDKASFYFALYHELGHVKSDYNKAKSKVIIDEDDFLEKRADEFALNMMIRPSIWNEIIKDKNNVLSICEENNIPVCFGVWRLAKEDYIDYTSKLYNNYREKIDI